ncbi:hypothetical protein IFM89_016332 [Coptis chinensis]|uniref:Uncharacterized protein n=1 Tax=Coptis chinensis TaxID=261450 RepID=A0A835LRU4_9MAGN|nr:hypothetical protein IFM89_016332 [Coptis chinensis]
MIDINTPFDFEFDEPLPSSLPTPKRRKVIELDDLLTDYYKEKSKSIEKESKKAKFRKISKPDDDDDDTHQDKKEAMLSHFVDECHKKARMRAEDEIKEWGLRVFGNQKALPVLDFPQLGSCVFLQSVMKNKMNSVLELSAEKGQIFLEELLINGWLSELVITCAHVEECITTWTFNLMLYSRNEELRTSASNFWCTVLSHNDEHGLCSIRIDGFPSYSELKRALEVYGYQLYSSDNFSSLPEMSDAGPSSPIMFGWVRDTKLTDEIDSDSEGPPQNIRCWVKFVAVCSQVRSTLPIISNNSEAEELLGAIISFFLDRQLQGLSLLFYECMLSVISSFTDNEWSSSCERVAKSLAISTQKDLNSLRLAECISGVDARSKQLRREVGFQILKKFFNMKNALKRKWKASIVFNEEYWLFSNPLLEEKPYIREMWGVYLRNYSCQIASTDMRPCASKVRNKASFLLQSTVNRKDGE